MLFFSSGVVATNNVDYLSFAHGALPVSVAAEGKKLRVGFEHAIKAIDGNHSGYILTPKPGSSATTVEIVYELPALTTFEQFVIPNILETPSPSQTFVGHLSIFGSTKSAESEFTQLASHELKTHDKKGLSTDIKADQSIPVRWVKVQFTGGINIEREKTFFEFSEIEGYGSQQSVALSDAFQGIWKGRGVLVELKQNEAVVTGCYDKVGDLSGTVSGNVLHASGVSRSDGTPSLFVLTVDADGALRGLRSSNGAPFKMYTGDPVNSGVSTECSEKTVSTLGCGSVIHGIRFAYDSAELREESDVILTQLYSGLSESPDTSIVIEGHTSSEGSKEYNADLSKRRAAAVVKQLVRQGIRQDRIEAIGYGESNPIASNDDEAGRSLNRRVEVRCM